MNDILRLSQLKLLDSLVIFSKICEENNLTYWLDSGTLLGAVRHKGFIPWDDDIDICMPRNDFDAFLKLSSKLNYNDIFIQTLQTDSQYKIWNIPCKIRVNNTLIIEKQSLETNSFNPNCHNGLFMDVLPVDKSPSSNFIELLIICLKKLYTIKFLNTNRGHISLRKFISLFGTLLPLKLLETIKSKLVSSLDGKFYIYGIELPFKRRYFEESDIFPLSKISFEGHEFSCPNDVHIYLTKLYGSNYMQLPPSESRVSHHQKIEIY